MATPLASAGNVGSASASSSGSSRRLSRCSSSADSGCASAQAAYASSHSAPHAEPRSRSSRVCSSTPGGISKVCSGSKPRTFLVAATSSAPERAAVGRLGALRVGRGPRDDRVEDDERGLVGHAAGLADGVVEGRDVLDVVGAAVGPVDGLDVPAVGLVAGGDVLGEGDVGVALDRDPVAVVDDGEVAELLGAGDRARLGADALLEVAVGGQDVDLVVEEALAGRGVGVEHAVDASCRQRHADGVADALAQRAGRDLDAGGVAELGVAGGLGAPGAQRLEVVELEAEAAEVELGVEGDASVAARQHEAVAGDPLGVGRVVAHDLLEEQVRHRREAHGGAGVAVADLLDRVHRQDPGGVDRALVDVVPLEGGGQGGLLGQRGSSRWSAARARAGARAGVQDHRCVRWPRLRAYRRGRVDSTPPDGPSGCRFMCSSSTSVPRSRDRIRPVPPPPATEVPTVSHAGPHAAIRAAVDR